MYQKRGVLRANPVIRQLVDRGQPESTQREFQHTYAVLEAGTRKGLAAFQSLKEKMDKQLLAKDYSEWSRVAVMFQGDLCIASTGAVSPNWDLNGAPLQVLHDPTAPQHTLLFGVVAVPGGGAVVLTWAKGESAPWHFLKSFLEQGQEKLPGLLVQFMFAYVRNTYFSNR